MADAHDPANFSGRAARQKELIHEEVDDPDRKAILKTLKAGRRGKLTDDNDDGWSKATLRNNARYLRILAVDLTQEQYAEYPDNLVDFDSTPFNAFIDELAVNKGWSDGTERNYAMAARNLCKAHDREDTAAAIKYPTVDQTSKVNAETVLTRDEAIILIEGADSLRDKAMIAVLWESASRITAITALKLKHYQPKNDGKYALLRLPGDHVEGLKGAENDVKPLTFACGYVDPWIADHPRKDDEEAPLFCSIRDRDRGEHMHPHSVYTHLKRLAKRTDGISADRIHPHAFKHGRGTEMRKSEEYAKEDIELIMDWEEGTPLHQRYEHVENEDEAKRILQKRGIEVEDGEPVAEEEDCPRCGTRIAIEANYCPQCGLRPSAEPPRWWQVYRSATKEDNPIRIQFKHDLPPASPSELPPKVFDRVLNRLLNSMLVTADKEAAAKFGMDTSPVRELSMEDAIWVFNHFSDIAEDHRREYPVARLLLDRSTEMFPTESE